MTAYVVFIKEETHDQAALDRYAPMAVQARAGHDVVPLARYGALTMLEGAPVEGAVILRFDTVEAARSWYDSPAYRQAAAHRMAGARYSAFVVEGVD